MQISIRLYRQHDMDLIRMYMNKSFKFTSEMKNALISFANNTPYQIITPNDTLPEYHQHTPRLSKISKNKYYASYRYQ